MTRGDSKEAVTAKDIILHHLREQAHAPLLPVQSGRAMKRRIKQLLAGAALLGALAFLYSSWRGERERSAPGAVGRTAAARRPVFFVGLDGADWSLLDVARLRDELAGLFGRPVDLVGERNVTNPYRLASIRRDRRLLYAA